MHIFAISKPFRQDQLRDDQTQKVNILSYVPIHDSECTPIESWLGHDGKNVTCKSK